MKPKVAVAMSGGVDSSVAAYLLLEQGYEVMGVSMRLYDAREGTRSSGCCSPEDFRDARAVASQLGIPYYVMNFTREFEHQVIDRFVAGYLAGLTPSPCILCNTHLKFRHLLARMRAAGADLVATGHYAGREGEGPWRLVRARDAAKDQTYFLFGINQQELERTLFPMAQITKDQVRSLAAGAGLPTAGKRESQEICFVPDGRYADFVEQRAGGARPGLIRDAGGRELGQHDGIHRFTVGQRRGLGVSAPQRLYVTRVDAHTNTVYVGPEEELSCVRFDLVGVSWIGPPPRAPSEVEVKVRSTHQGVPARVTPLEAGHAAVRLLSPVRGVAPGQAAVFYDGREVLGGGWIRLPCPD